MVFILKVLTDLKSTILIFRLLVLQSLYLEKYFLFYFLCRLYNFIKNYFYNNI